MPKCQNEREPPMRHMRHAAFLFFTEVFLAVVGMLVLTNPAAIAILASFAAAVAGFYLWTWPGFRALVTRRLEARWVITTTQWWSVGSLLIVGCGVLFYFALGGLLAGQLYEVTSTHVVSKGP